MSVEQLEGMSFAGFYPKNVRFQWEKVKVWEMHGKEGKCPEVELWVGLTRWDLQVWWQEEVEAEHCDLPHPHRDDLPHPQAFPGEFSLQLPLRGNQNLN